MITEEIRMTPEKAVSLLKKQGLEISIGDAIAIIQFMHLLADICLNDLEGK